MKPASQSEINRALYPRRSKYGAKRHEGYSSKKEFARAQELKILQRAGIISDLKEQVRFELLPRTGKDRAVTYVCDFTYNEFNGTVWLPVTEDVKGFRTPIYRLKKRLMKALLGIEVKEF